MTAPYGSWPSPITAESLTEKALGLGETMFDTAPDRDDLYWLQADPTEGGRVSLWRRSPNGAERELTPAPYNVRSRVHEYGGGAFAAAGGRVVFSNLGDNRIHLIESDGSIRPLTSDTRLRYGALRFDPERDLIIAVREDHRRPAEDPAARSGGTEPINTIIARPISASPADDDLLLCRGADFYASPELSPDGRLAWIEWSHPNMPWDSTRLMISALPTADQREDLDRRRLPLAGAPIAGTTDSDLDAAESVAAPAWLPDGSLIFVSDRSDWWNLYRFDGARTTALYPMDAEFTPPPWSLGLRPYVIIDDDRIGCWWNTGNRHQIGVLNRASGELTEIETGAVAAGNLTGTAGVLATRLDFPDRPSELTMINIDTGDRSVLRRSSPTTLRPELISTAIEVEWDSDLGPVYGWFYPPRHQDAPTAELPPMITVSHGGPTGASAPSFDLGVQFWTSRGIAVLDVNYGGSTGYGRRYRERLHRGWGVVDVADCVAGARAMVEQGRVDQKRLAIMGSSAGGYTTLQALVTHDLFTAGISRYGIGDLTALVADTHKFESRYPESLIGRYPDERQIYTERSPINHVDRLTAPILLLQGSEDAVVPPNQAETFASAAREKGLPVAMIMYPGEGHGFRTAANIISSQQACLAFLGRVFGFDPADELPPLQIDNAPD